MWRGLGMANTLMTGKRGLIMGLANDKSIAWGIAKACADAGADLAFSYQGEALKKRVAPLAAELGSDIVLPCDVADMASIDALFAGLGQHWDGLDFVVATDADRPRAGGAPERPGPLELLQVDQQLPRHAALYVQVGRVPHGEEQQREHQVVLPVRGWRQVFAEQFEEQGVVRVAELRRKAEQGLVTPPAWLGGHRKLSYRQQPAFFHVVGNPGAALAPCGLRRPLSSDPEVPPGAPSRRRGASRRRNGGRRRSGSADAARRPHHPCIPPAR